MKSDQRGFTLVELLAAVTLTALVIILLGSVHLFAQKQYNYQTEAVNHQKEVRLAMTSITQQLRTVTSDQITFDGNTLTIGSNIYHWNDHNSSITLNGTSLAHGIAEFDVQLCTETNTCDQPHINILIKSQENKQGKIADLTSTIYFRE